MFTRTTTSLGLFSMVPSNRSGLSAIDRIRELAKTAEQLKDKPADKSVAAQTATSSTEGRLVGEIVTRAQELKAAQTARSAEPATPAADEEPTRSAVPMATPDLTISIENSSWFSMFIRAATPPEPPPKPAESCRIDLPDWGKDPIDVASVTEDGEINRAALLSKVILYDGAPELAMAGVSGTFRPGMAASVYGHGDITVAGGLGDDWISGDADRLVVDGGGGNDSVWGGTGSILFGGAGDDALVGLDKLVADGGDGNDAISGYNDVLLDGGVGDDHLSGRDNSRIYGGDGNDLIDAYDHSIVDAGEGDDAVWVFDDTTVNAGDGNDIVFARSGARVEAGSGDDIVTVWGNSYVDAGTGNDNIAVAAGSTVHFSRGDGVDRLTLLADPGYIFGRRAQDGQADGVTVTFDNISIKDVEMAVEGDDIRLSFGDGDGLLLVGAAAGGAAPTLQFCDGTIDAEALQAREIMA